MDSVARFAELVRRPPDEVDLADAALAIAAGADPQVQPGRWKEELDRLAAGVTDRDGLVRRLFTQRGFTGDAADYYNPDNSLLHRVLARRLGIPITLSVVMLEVGRRAGVDLEGVGMPGHFLVRDPADGALLDPFHGGQLLDRSAVEGRFRAATGAGPAVPFGPHLLRAVTAHEVLDRMLANIAGIYRAAGERTLSWGTSASAGLEWVLRMRLALPSADAGRVLGLADALAARGRYRQAAAEIEERLAAHPDDAERLQAAARTLRARLN